MPWMSVNAWKKKYKIGTKKPKLFKLLGFDTFSSEWYNLGEFETEQMARTAGLVRLRALEQSQPTASSGGQGFGGIQDQVYIEYQDGKRSRLIG